MRTIEFTAGDASVACGFRNVIGDVPKCMEPGAGPCTLY